MTSRREIIAGIGGFAAWGMAGCAPLLGSDAGRLKARIQAIEAATGGAFGVAFHDARSGRSFAHRGAERFAMASTFKASLAALALAAEREGRIDLSERTRWTEADLVPYRPFAEARLAKGATWRELAEAAQVLSDNTAANLLLARLGGPAALTAFWRGSGDPVSRLDRNEPDLNRVPPGDPRDTTTPKAMARTLHRLLFSAKAPLAAEQQAELRGWMTATETGAKRVRAGLPSGWETGDKTGTSGAWPDAPFVRGDIGYAIAPGGAPVTFAVYHRSPVRAGPITAERADAGFARIGSVLGDWMRPLGADAPV